MPASVTLLQRSRRYTFWTVATGKPGGRSYSGTRSARWVGSSVPGRVPGGVDSRWIGLSLLFYPFPFPLSSIANRVGEAVCGERLC